MGAIIMVGASLTSMVCGCCIGSAVGVGLAFAGYAIAIASASITASWIWFGLFIGIALILTIVLCATMNPEKVDMENGPDTTMAIIRGCFPGLLIGLLITHLCLVFTDFGDYETL